MMPLLQLSASPVQVHIAPLVASLQRIHDTMRHFVLEGAARRAVFAALLDLEQAPPPPQHTHTHTHARVCIVRGAVSRKP